MPVLRLEGKVLGMNVGSDIQPDITMVQAAAETAQHGQRAGET